MDIQAMSNFILFCFSVTNNAIVNTLLITGECLWAYLWEKFPKSELHGQTVCAFKVFIDLIKLPSKT